MQLKFRPSALADLEEIYDYIAADNPAGYSGPNLPRIPAQIFHRFRAKSSTDSGSNLPRMRGRIFHGFGAPTAPCKRAL